MNWKKLMIGLLVAVVYVALMAYTNTNFDEVTL